MSKIDLHIKVVAVNSAALLDEVAKFRYHVYVDLMKRQQRYADHLLRKIIERLDANGINCAVSVGDRIVGSVRGNRFSELESSYYFKIYKIRKFAGFDPHEMLFTTKLMVLPEFRKSIVTAKLLREFAKIGYKSGIKLNFIDCNKPLIPLFEGMGYFSYTGWTFHKEFGTVRPMFVATDTLRYKHALKSILYEPARACLTDNQYGGYATVQRYAERPACPISSEVADRFFEFLSHS